MPPAVPLSHKAKRFLPRADFGRLLAQLGKSGFDCFGPQLVDGAIAYRRLSSLTELPQGVHERQAPGYYRTQQDAGPRWFAWANGPQALKPLLFAPREVLWRADRQSDGTLAFRAPSSEAKPIAVIGVRACDLAALAIHDAHFLHSATRDPAYAARREHLLLIAVNCSHPAATCFCVSTGDGPNATAGFDIVLDELDDGFTAAAVRSRGARLLASLHLARASVRQLAEARAQWRRAVAAQTRTLPGRNLRGALFSRLEHPRWNEVAARCLSCGNCTLVCPTCFCHAESDAPALDGASSEHAREWDSCFTAGHSRLHGLTVRADTRTRYRQWLTHKLGSWHEQFGRSGCVGCVRCITWCPVGIDITEEATAICGRRP